MEFDIQQMVASSGIRSVQAKALLVNLGNGIVSGVLAQGTRLPAERELAVTYEISRGAARYVLSHLEHAGLVKRVRGSGTFVCWHHGEKEAEDALDLLGDISLETSPAELMEVRLLLEPLLPELIVRYATSSDFAVMEDCIAKAQAAQTIDEYEKWDGALHTAFAAATHNSFFVYMFKVMHRIREQGEWGRLKHRSLTDVKRDRYQEQHRCIVDALKDRDAGAARLVLAEHLSEIKKNLFRID